MKQKQKIIYYNERGEIDKFATFVNNNEWATVVWFILSVLFIGFVEGM